MHLIYLTIEDTLLIFNDTRNGNSFQRGQILVGFFGFRIMVALGFFGFRIRIMVALRSSNNI